MQWQQLCCCVHLPVCPIDAATAILSLQLWAMVQVVAVVEVLQALHVMGCEGGCRKW